MYGNWERSFRVSREESLGEPENRAWGGGRGLGVLRFLG